MKQKAVIVAAASLYVLLLGQGSEREKEHIKSTENSRLGNQFEKPQRKVY